MEIELSFKRLKILMVKSLESSDTYIDFIKNLIQEIYRCGYEDGKDVYRIE